MTESNRRKQSSKWCEEGGKENRIDYNRGQVRNGLECKSHTICLKGTRGLCKQIFKKIFIYDFRLCDTGTAAVEGLDSPDIDNPLFLSWSTRQ